MNKSKTPFWGMPQPQPRQRAPSKVRVRQIPVHFVGSERNRADSATKIQKVLRGYLVRKSVKKMVAMKVELEQIETNVHAPETVEKMRKEKKERVRVGESIMNLLLRLDSVKVLHCSALRDCRKSLIKRAIALQEMVDQIEGTGDSIADSSEMMAVTDSAGGKFEALEVEEEKKMNVEEEEEDGEKGNCVGAESVEEKLVEEGCLVKEEEGQGGCEEHEEGQQIETLRDEEKIEENPLVKEEEGKGGYEGGVVYDEHEQGKEIEALVNKEEEDGVAEESVGTSLVEEEKGEEVGCEEEKGKDCEGENRELLKRMMQDNEKMMGMMAQLFEKNEKQTKLLSCLTQRVEMLERAFACDKLRRKKRRNVDAKHRDHDPKNGCC
ncbi:BAG family molecular chaperone regulator 6-like [Lotus japonicus]|uniref:BAG family molecular chaperone regulator 6-like n=1 Tax=Lotus japonicus TaxID=34305 RepID=UPI00258A8164|nr:BAG family molecular chaperone regulator 6-like [Lotus japonicus]